MRIGNSLDGVSWEIWKLWRWHVMRLRNLWDGISWKFWNSWVGISWDFKAHKMAFYENVSKFFLVNHKAIENINERLYYLIKYICKLHLCLELLLSPVLNVAISVRGSRVHISDKIKNVSAFIHVREIFIIVTFNSEKLTQLRPSFLNHDFYQVFHRSFLSPWPDNWKAFYLLGHRRSPRHEIDDIILAWVKKQCI